MEAEGRHEKAEGRQKCRCGGGHRETRAEAGQKRWNGSRHVEAEGGREEDRRRHRQADGTDSMTVGAQVDT